MSELYNVLVKLCDEKEISAYKMCKDLGIQPSIMTDLKMGRRSSVKAETAQKIALYFDVSVGYLLGTEQQEKKTNIDDGFLRVMQKAKDKGYSPNDIQLLLDFLDQAKKRDEDI